MPVAIFGQTGLIGSAVKNEFQDNFFDVQINQWTESEIVSTWNQLTGLITTSSMPIDLV